MKKHLITISIFITQLLLFSLIETAYSDTSIQVGGLAEQLGIETTTIQMDIDDAADMNGPNIADAFALANILGYPIGKAYIGSLPHFEMGVSLGAGGTNMEFFNDESPASDNGSIPGLISNTVAHFGVGLGGGFDVIGKLLYFDRSVLTRFVDEESLAFDADEYEVTVKEVKMYSIGGKVRYNIIERNSIFPYFFEFGGITISLGADYMHWNFGLEGGYEYPLTSTTVPLPAPVGDQEIDLTFDGDFDLYIEGTIFSLTTQVIAYVDLFYFFSFYSGFGLTGNYGSFEIDFDGNGNLVTDSTVFQQLNGTLVVGSLLFDTSNKYKPKYILPTYIIGLEINVFVVKLNFETMVSMGNRSDVNVQGGVRFEM